MILDIDATLSACVIILCALFSLFISFYSICIIGDEFLVPAVAVFIKQYDIPEEVAAVTLIAFGSAAPELLLNSVSAFKKTQTSMSLTLPAILGSAMIAFGLIPSMCVLFNHEGEMTLQIWPIIRETSFYLFGLCNFLLSILDGEISTAEAITISSVYLVYVGLVLGLYIISSPSSTRKQQQQISDSNVKLLHVYNNNNESEVEMLISMDDSDASDNVTSTVSSVGSACLCIVMMYSWGQKYLSVFIALFFPRLQPSPTIGTTINTAAAGDEYNKNGYNRIPRVPLWRAFAVTILSVTYIGLLAAAIVSSSTVIVSYMHINKATVGATIIALGAEIPDLVSSISLSKGGFHDAAMAGAIGSQVINISLGVGLPSLFVCLTGSGTLPISPAQISSLWLLTVLAMAVIFMYLAVVIPVSKVLGLLTGSNRLLTASGSGSSFPSSSKLTSLGGWVLLGTWCTVFIAFIYKNEDD